MLVRYDKPEFDLPSESFHLIKTINNEMEAFYKTHKSRKDFVKWINLKPYCKGFFALKGQYEEMNYLVYVIPDISNLRNIVLLRAACEVL